ncbi:unnamed protein product, partial [Vitis vinifera]|uniref:Disease resistance protein RGA3 n=1 Tax=Vitis vinifera TaxID=29760 RepID=D7SYV8_VITVI
MAESFLFSIADNVLGKIGSVTLQEIGLAWGVKTELQKLEATLTAIKSVLLDAEEKQWKDRQLRDWLGKLKHVCYDVEDVLDEFRYQALQRQVVSHGSLKTKVIIDIIKSIKTTVEGGSGLGLPNHNDLNMEQAQTLLRRTLGNEKIFLVLDDMWNEDRQKWIELRTFLMNGAKGNKIVVTTRGHPVASIMGTVQAYILEGLPHDYCLSVFLKWAFNEGQEKQHPNLVKIGDDIVKKCNGVPLAARTLGSLLFSKFEQRDWLYVRNNDIWKLEQKEGDILPALRLSYEQLPSYLKCCFAYCSIFPKDEVLNNLSLVCMWSAQGLIEPSKKKQELDDIGNRYIKEMLSRSFFQDFKIINCILHLKCMI